MGTSPSPVSPSSLSLHSPLDDWFSTTHFSAAEALLPHDALSSASGSPSSSSCSSDRAQGRSFLRSNDLDAPLYLQAHMAFSQVGSPVLSSTSASKEKPVSPLNTNSGCVSAMSTYSMPNCNATKPLQAFHGGFNHLANPILKPLEENTSSCISSILTSASASVSSGALSSPASTGAAAAKVSKRRARVNKKAPIAVLSADTSNFRAMVQQLTGIPPTHASPQIWGSSGAPLLRPQPTRFAYNGGLPTLDTSVSFLGPRQILPLLQRNQQPLMNGLSSSGASKNAAEFSSSQGRGNMGSYDTSSLTSIPGPLNAPGSGTPSGLQMKGELSVENLVRECEQSFPRQSSSLFESLLPLDEDVFGKSSLSAVDSWMASDGGALLNLSPMVDLAKIAS